MVIFHKWKLIIGLALILLTTGKLFAQQEPLFNKMPLDSLGIRCYEMLCSKGGCVRIISSIGFLKSKGHEVVGGIKLNNDSKIKNFRNYLAEDGIRAMAEGPDSVFFFAANDNSILFNFNADQVTTFNWPPFYFPPVGEPFDKVSSLYIDNSGDLFIGTAADNFYRVKEGANLISWADVEMKVVDSSLVITKGERTVKKIILAPQIGVFSFAQDGIDKNILWMGTNHGLYRFNKSTDDSKIINSINLDTGLSFTITHIELNKEGNLWFSTLEKGMGFYDQQKNKMQFYPYPKKYKTSSTQYPIKTFCYKSANEFFTAVMDSLPAVFYTKNGTYAFIDDSSLNKSVNSTTDIKVDQLGNLLLIKGGIFYYCSTTDKKTLATDIKPDSSLLAPFIRAVILPNEEPITAIDYYPEMFNELQLKYNQNSFKVYYDINGFESKKKIQFAWQIEGFTNGWQILPSFNLDKISYASVDNLKPGKYVFELKVKVGNEDWRKQQAKMVIIIAKPD